ncbi:hypothetical protein ECP03018678_4827 [Escherichia coli P0301867.8]|nr:hypothetical protein ECP03018678_4827 [Escherichia coli P0301867.8]
MGSLHITSVGMEQQSLLQKNYQLESSSVHTMVVIVIFFKG